MNTYKQTCINFTEAIPLCDNYNYILIHVTHDNKTQIRDSLVALYIVCFIVVVYDVNLYIIIIVTQRDGFRKVNGKSRTYHLPV